MNNKKIFYIFLILAGMYILAKLLIPQLIELPLWAGDFTTYWLSGKLFIQGENPYSFKDLQLLKEKEGFEFSNFDGVPRYPPWSIPIMALMALFDYKTSLLIAVIVYIVILILSGDLLWTLYGGGHDKKWIVHILVFSFAPTLFTIGRAQLSPLVLLGIVGVIIFHNKPNWDWMAGASLLLVSIKPHVAYLFLFYLILWIIYNRRWGIICGGVISFVIIMTITFFVNPSLSYQFISAEQLNYRQLDWATPTIGFWLRSILNNKHELIAFIPLLMSIIWLVWKWQRNRHKIEFITVAPQLLLLSTVFAVFMWTYDMVILIPAIVEGTVQLYKRFPHHRIFWFLILVFVLFNSLTFWLHTIYDDRWFFWFAPVMLLGYWLIKRVSIQSASQYISDPI